MCYEVSSGLKAALKYAKKRHADPTVIADLEKKLERWLEQTQSHYHISGFDHPKLLVFTNEDPLEPQSYNWGLIPSWTKDESMATIIQNQTLNARSESMFEKPSFRGAAKSKRCLIYIDGFFEYHHHKGKTYPFYIRHKDDSPLIIAGLWEQWLNKSNGELIQTMSMVTCIGNETMSKIHNNPKLAGPRMPVILSQESQNLWLEASSSEGELLEVLLLCKQYPDNLLEYYTVKKLKGKGAAADSEMALKEFKYEELASMSIF